MWVVKLGGSVFDAPQLRDWLRLFATRGAGRVVVVPGGGRFADAVRAEQRRLCFDDLAAHNMAVLAMAQAAQMLHALQPALRLAADAPAVHAAWRDGAAALWQPFAALRDAPDALTSWDATSDSLAAWLAARLEARHLLLVKWHEPPPHACLAELAAVGYVDRAFARFAAGFAGTVRLVPRDGLQRVACWLDSDAQAGASDIGRR
jgi:aspartokinase-like uncharacterized kinase